MHVHSTARLPVLPAVLMILVTLFAETGRGAEPQIRLPLKPRYPHVNLATWYRVDPDWPQRPSHFEPGAVAGLAVDEKDQVWVFTRTDPAVQVYDSDGGLVRAWGKGLIKEAHHIKIDYR